ncbi:MAG: AraC family transcriptional regulator [Steroidobacteraceae bacterium]
MAHPQRAARNDGYVMIASIAAAPRLIARLGGEPDVVARKAGLDPTQFRDLSSLVPFTVIGRYVEAAIEATGCPHFGLLLGAEEGFANLGIVGRLAEHSPTVGAALRDLAANFHVYEVGATTSIMIERDVASLVYTLEQPLPASEQVVDAALAIGLGLMRQMCGPLWAPLEVRLMRARPADTAPYRRTLGERVRYGADRNAVMFPARWLAHRLEGAEPDLREYLADRVAEMRGDPPTRFTSRVRTVMRARLLSGDCTTARVAAALAVSTRTLHRRLAEHGATFEAMLDALRYDIARQMLENSSASLGEISTALGYANGSAFTRAFKRWSGRAPREWRAASRPH